MICLPISLSAYVGSVSPCELTLGAGISCTGVVEVTVGPAVALSPPGTLRRANSASSGSGSRESRRLIPPPLASNSLHQIEA